MILREEIQSLGRGYLPLGQAFFHISMVFDWG
jgi:hypothetical protein